MQPVDNFFTSITTYYILFNTIVFLILSSVVFVYQNLWQLEVALRTCIAVVGGLQVAGMFISHGLKMDKIKEFHQKLREVCDESVNGKSMVHFAFVHLITIDAKASNLLLYLNFNRWQ